MVLIRKIRNYSLCYNINMENTALTPPTNNRSEMIQLLFVKAETKALVVSINDYIIEITYNHES